MGENSRWGIPTDSNSFWYGKGPKGLILEKGASGREKRNIRSCGRFGRGRVQENVKIG